MSILFSIVTPSLNQGRFIERSIRSVLSQEGDFRVDYIIVDGGSSDETLAIIKEYDCLLQNGRLPIKCNGVSIRWSSEQDHGQSHAINKGFTQARGEIYAWLNSDDYYSDGALSVIADYAKLHPEAEAFVGGGEMRDLDGNLVQYKPAFDVDPETLFGWINQYFYQPSCFFRRNAWQKCGPLEEWLEYAMDLDLWIKIAKKFKFVPVVEMLSTSQRHAAAKTTACWHLTAMEVALVIASYGGIKTVRADYGQFIDSKAKEHRQQVSQILNSRSWKITLPLRLLAEWYRKI